MHLLSQIFIKNLLTRLPLFFRIFKAASFLLIFFLTFFILYSQPATRSLGFLGF